MQLVDKLTIHVVVDNTADMLSSRPKHVASEVRVLMDAGMTELAGEALLSAQHGLCLAVTAHRESQARTVLFDAGPDPYALERNGRHMHLDFGRIEALVLSHGHFDHSEGLVKAVELIRGANGGQPGPAARASRSLRQTGPAAAQWRDASVPGRAVAAHARRAGRSMWSPPPRRRKSWTGCFISVVRSPAGASRHGFKTHFKRAADGNWEADPWIMDRHFMAAHVRGKGIAIFTGCSHAGVVNICRHAWDVFPDVPLYALVGGLQPRSIRMKTSSLRRSPSFAPSACR